jgi:hypothetical protein
MNVIMLALGYPGEMPYFAGAVGWREGLWLSDAVRCASADQGAPVGVPAGPQLHR